MHATPALPREADHPGRALAATVPFLLALFAAVALHLVLPHDGAYATAPPAAAVGHDTDAPATNRAAAPTQQAQSRTQHGARP